MPYYTFKVYSANKNVLTKQFASQDCLDLHFLLANKDYIGVDLFCEKKFKEYTGEGFKLNNLDKFLYLFSQKILSHSFTTTVVHSYASNESKITKLIDLVKIYNHVSDAKFELSKEFNHNNLYIKYGVPYNLSDNKFFNFYVIKLGDKEYKDVNMYDCDNMSFLPIKLYTEMQNMQLENNKNIKSDYFTSNFVRELTFTNECFLYILEFIYNENVAELFTLTYTLNKDYNIQFEHLRSITLRELYLLVDTINKIAQEKKERTTQ